MAQKTGDKKIATLAEALNKANSDFLNNNKSPSRKAGELDTRGSHYYLSLYWAQALAAQDDDAELKAQFAPVAEALSSQEETINRELIEVQGKAVDIGGYYHPDKATTSQVMRPSASWNAVIDSLL